MAMYCRRSGFENIFNLILKRELYIFENEVFCSKIYVLNQVKNFLYDG
jgi:hypothetical protein